MTGVNNKLVTLIGGGGFIGRYVAQALLKAGARVRIAQRDPRQAFFLKPLGALGQTQFVAVDVTRSDTVARAVEHADGVVNLVGSFAGDLQRIHVEGARAVAEAALAGSVYAPVSGATFYHADSILPWWASSLTRIGSVGAHIFYRWRGGWGRPSRR